MNVDDLKKSDITKWKIGQTLLLSGKILTARDAAHKKIQDLISSGKTLPSELNLFNRLLYYVGPVDAVGDEAVGPAGPTTATRMDKYTDLILNKCGVIGMIGKAERSRKAIASIKKNKAAYLIAVGGAAFLVSKAIKSSRVIAFPELDMEAVHEFEVEDMPVTVAVDSSGLSIHEEGVAKWKNHIINKV